MKILLVNKFYFLHRGAERIFLDTADLLRAHGHEVVIFSMRHSKNLPSPHEKYFVSFVETANPGIKESMRAFLRSLYSFEAAQRLEQLVIKEKPDIAHLHNFYHQISPSILRVLKKHHIPVVVSAHDYKLICPGYHLNKKGLICPRNIGRHAWHNFYHQTAGHKGKINKFLASGAMSLEWLLHKTLQVYERGIDQIIAPSRYVADRFMEHGWPEEKIVVIPHFYTSIQSTIMTVSEEQEKNKSVLYFGGGDEKGVDIFYETAQLLPHITFIGLGQFDLPGPRLPNIILLGHQNRDTLEKVYSEASLLFVPSLAQETFGLVVLEAARFKLPSVASNLGALPEIIKDGETGLLFNPLGADASSKAAALIDFLWLNKKQREKMGQKAFELTSAFSPEGHYQKLMQNYLLLRPKHGTFKKII